MAATQVSTRGKLEKGVDKFGAGVVPGENGYGAVTVNYDFGAGLDEKRKRFGDEVTDKHAESSMEVWLQAAVRRLIAKGKSAAEIQSAISTMKPGLVVRTTKDKGAEYAAYIKSLSPEEKAKEIEKLKAILAAK